MKPYIKLLRISHYLKNVLVFLPLVFAGKVFDMDYLLKALIGFVVFSLLSSIVYIVNDIVDCEKDKLHPTKKNRPIASGVISKARAGIIALILGFIICVLVTLVGGWSTSAWLLVYLVCNFAYSVSLKNVPIVDVTILSTGFLLRVLYGATITGIVVSNWLYLTILTLSFYMGLGKRRNEWSADDNKTRDVLRFYTKNFLDKNMYVCLTLAVTFYSLWCIDRSAVTPNIMLTIPLVLVICMKYSLNVEGDSDGDPIGIVLNDKWLIGLGLVYVIITMYMIYFGGVV